MDNFTYNLVVIGSGPGGYIAAIRASQLGLKTALIEKYDTLGGTCLNVGCIPSKALLYSSEYYDQARNKFSDHGIKIEKLALDFEKMMARKDKVVEQTCQGVDYLMKKNKIEVFKGTASFENKNEISIFKADHSKEKISFKNAIIATGSKPTELPFCKIDKNRIISSTEALSLKEIPKHLVIVGAGVIGLELGSLYKRLGAEVSIVEYSSNIISQMDEDLGKELQKILIKSGINFYLSSAVKNISSNGRKTILKANHLENQKEISLEGDYCLLAVGRTPYTEGLGLEFIGIERDEKGFIKVNEKLQTNIENIYALGDVIYKGPMLAHKASEEGTFIAESLMGQKPHINYNLIPSVVYTWPEVASVGKTEKELKKESISYKVGRFPMKALGIARASGDIEGFIKVLSNKKTDEILGVHMIGPRAADLISEAVVAMEFRASAEDLARITHPHPTFSESLKEASLGATENRALHI